MARMPPGSSIPHGVGPGPSASLCISGFTPSSDRLVLGSNRPGGWAEGVSGMGGWRPGTAKKGNGPATALKGDKARCSYPKPYWAWHG